MGLDRLYADYPLDAWLDQMDAETAEPPTLPIVGLVTSGRTVPEILGAYPCLEEGDIRERLVRRLVIGSPRADRSTPPVFSNDTRQARA